MAFSKETKQVVETVMKQKACSSEEAIAYLIKLLDKQRIC